MPVLSPEIPEPNSPEQRRFVESPAKRKIARAGRRGGKTEGDAIIGGRAFKSGRRVLYGVPTAEQLDRWWFLICQFYRKDIDSGVLYKNETRHLLEIPGTEHRIRGKTCWDADTLRGDYADLLILDEFQLMSENTWGLVGAPMLLDNDGDAVFTYTPPSLHSRKSVVSKAKDPQHAAKMFKEFSEDKTGRSAAFHWTSHANPAINKTALSEITRDMTALAVRMEIGAEDVNEAPGALWKRKDIDDNRVLWAPELSRIVVGVDPSATSTGDEAGIITTGIHKEDGYVLSDDSVQGSPLVWAQAAVMAYHKYQADRIIAESNQGGEMVELTIAQVDPNVPVELVHASRGKSARAEPVAARYEKGKVHHVGTFEKLENELCLWQPGGESPNRLDALTWALSSLLFSPVPGFFLAGRSHGREQEEEKKRQEEEKKRAEQEQARLKEQPSSPGNGGNGDRPPVVQDQQPGNGDGAKEPVPTPVKTRRDRRMERWLRGD